MFNKLQVTQKHKNKGMTLLEVIIVLGIMGVIAAGVVVLAQRAIDSQNITKLAQALNTIQTGMIQSFRGRSNYPVSKNDVQSEELRRALISMGRASTSDFVNPFTGNPLDVFSVAANGQANKAFIIRAANLSQDQCRTLVTNVIDLFSFIYVDNLNGTVPADVHQEAKADQTLGVLKSQTGTGQQFDMTNLTHIGQLCGGPAGNNGFYDVMMGSR